MGLPRRDACSPLVNKYRTPDSWQDKIVSQLATQCIKKSIMRCTTVEATPQRWAWQACGHSCGSKSSAIRSLSPKLRTSACNQTFPIKIGCNAQRVEGLSTMLKKFFAADVVCGRWIPDLASRTYASIKIRFLLGRRWGDCAKRYRCPSLSKAELLTRLDSMQHVVLYPRSFSVLVTGSNRTGIASSRFRIDFLSDSVEFLQIRNRFSPNIIACERYVEWRVEDIELGSAPGPGQLVGIMLSRTSRQTQRR